MYVHPTLKFQQMCSQPELVIQCINEKVQILLKHTFSNILITIFQYNLLSFILHI